MAELSGKRMFPCPVCAYPREVRTTKKKKPYLICDSCGIQLFVRGPAGIAAFERLMERAHGQGVFARVKEMEQRFYLRCHECGTRFWIEPQLVKTSMFDGSFQGFRCPEKKCDAIVSWKDQA